MLASNFFVIFTSALFQLGSAYEVVTGACTGRTEPINDKYQSGNRVPVPLIYAYKSKGFTFVPIDIENTTVIVHYKDDKEKSKNANVYNTKFNIYIQNLSSGKVSAQLGFFYSDKADPDFAFTLPAGPKETKVACVELESELTVTPVTIQTFKSG